MPKPFSISSKRFDNYGRTAALPWHGMTAVAVSWMTFCVFFLSGEMPAHAAGQPAVNGLRPLDQVPPLPSLDRLTDLSNRMAVTVTLVGRDSFKNEFRYEVSVKNQSPDTFNTDDVILVLDQIIDLAGKDALDRLEVVTPDGETADGKAYFKIPSGSAGKLSPYAESLPAIIRVRNAAYTAVFTPSFRVFGILQKGKPQVELGDLIQLLIKKGLVTEDELRNLRAR